MLEDTVQNSTVDIVSLNGIHLSFQSGEWWGSDRTRTSQETRLKVKIIFHFQKDVEYLRIMTCLLNNATIYLVGEVFGTL